MKAKTKKAAKSAPSAQPAKAVAAAPVKAKPVILFNQVDTHVGYNSSGRFKTKEYQKSIVEGVKELPSKFGAQMYLVTRGDKGRLINAVDVAPDMDLYRRAGTEGYIYGSLNRLNELEKGFTAKFYTAQALIEEAMKKVKVMRFKNRKTGEELDVALLNPSTEPYFVGICLDAKGNLRVENMEPAARYNGKEVQWIQIRDVSDAKLVTALTNFGAKKTAKAVVAP